MKNRVLSFDQESFLLKCVLLIEKELESSTYQHIWDVQHKWDLQREKRFIYRVLSDREYDSIKDADRLNSIRNLYGYLTKGVTTSN
jgi:hypothetical protein